MDLRTCSGMASISESYKSLLSRLNRNNHKYPDRLPCGLEEDKCPFLNLTSFLLDGEKKEVRSGTSHPTF